MDFYLFTVEFVIRALPFLLQCNIFLKKYFIITISFQVVLRWREKKSQYLFIDFGIPNALEGLYFSASRICFSSFPFHCIACFLELREIINGFAWATCFTRLFFVLVVITYLSCYIFILFHLYQIPKKNQATLPEYFCHIS